MTAVLLVAVVVLAALAWCPVRHPGRGAWRAPADGPRPRLPAWRAVLAPLFWTARRRRRSRPPDVGAVIGEVATRLRSGAPVEHAWTATVDRVLGPSDRVVGTGPLPAGLHRLAERCRGDAVARAAVTTVEAGTRLSQATGAPLADVLDRCVATVVEAERAHDERRVALAGPRSTARILTGLPVLGLLLGAGLGADPVAVALDGGWGTAAVAAGLSLLYAGARWTAALVRTAQGGSPRAVLRGPARPGAGGRRRTRGGGVDLGSPHRRGP